MNLVEILSAALPAMVVFIVAPLLNSYLVDYAIPAYYLKQQPQLANPSAPPLSDIIATAKCAIVTTATASAALVVASKTLAAARRRLRSVRSND